ncbi:hypothetical protein CDAR_538741 [Caerostris darwini]|uniref:Uncharacterized protein n=1 Tax=Caerostris darwini TaxID=1538125 RepID=A0AAV4T465_9ARAC|nr:hypothetical protein CDAR_538741 [Caerostris darwini]
MIMGMNFQALYNNIDFRVINMGTDFPAMNMNMDFRATNVGIDFRTMYLDAGPIHGEFPSFFPRYSWNKLFLFPAARNVRSSDTFPSHIFPPTLTSHRRKMFDKSPVNALP